MAREVTQPGFRIAGIGSALPERRVHNDEIAATLAAAHPEEYARKPTDDPWIRKSTGIVERPIADPNRGETTTGLAVAAGRLALKQSGFSPKSIEMLILATTTKDDNVPAGSPDIQRRLRLKNAFAHDLDAACSGFVFGLVEADAIMARKGLKRVMIIGADTLSTITDYTDRTTAPLFADGAGAVILEATDEDRGLIGSSLRSKGNKSVLYSPRYKKLRDGSMEKGTIRMKAGRPVFEAGVEYMVQTSLEAMEEAEVSAEEVTLVVPHQANLRMMRRTVEILGIPEEKMAVSIDHIGNSSAATVPISLDERLQIEELQPGDIVLMPVAGGGITGGAVVIKW